MGKLKKLKKLVGSNIYIWVPGETRMYRRGERNIYVAKQYATLFFDIGYSYIPQNPVEAFGKVYHPNLSDRRDLKRRGK